MELAEGGRREVALALLLWKDFKCQGKMDIDIFKQMFELADYLEVRNELETLNREILFPFEIKLKY